MDVKEPVNTDPKLPETVPAKQYKGLGGWLILPGLGLILSPLVLGFAIYQIIMLFLNDAAWSAITTVGSPQYIPNIAPLVIAEFLVNIAFFFFSLVLLYLFFKESRLIPKLMIIFYALSAVFVVLDLLVGSMVVNSHVDVDIGSIRAILTALIWIPYFMMSKRVKQTFVN